jgi:hypothetical protein
MTVDSGEELTVEVRGAFNNVEGNHAVSTPFTPACDGYPLGAHTRAIVERRAKPVEAVPASSTLGGDLGKTTTPPASVSL